MICYVFRREEVMYVMREVVIERKIKVIMESSLEIVVLSFL